MVHCASAGKTVLVVSDRARSLDIIHQRLTAIGLGELALPLHGQHDGRKRVLGSLVRVLDRSVRLAASTTAGDARLAELRGALDGYVTALGPWRNDDFMINGGFFALRREIFDYMQPGEELVEEPFTRLREKRLLATYRYAGFWQAMDTFKDKITFDRMEARGDCPWKVWDGRGPGATAPAAEG